MNKVSKWFIFSLVAMAQFMVVLDVAITNVALPTIKRNLHFAGDGMLQWVVTAYALAFGGFLLLGGRMADLYGRKRTLLIGMTAFIAFSFLIGLSQSPAMIIFLRALQGMAAALMSPSALSIVLVTFRDGPDRNKALGFWTLVATGGAAMGLLLGGLLTQYLGWRWNFFINVPVGILVALGIKRYVPAHEREATHNQLDLSGALLVTAGLITFVFATSQAPSWGWLSAATLGTIVASLSLLAGFVYNEKRVEHPLMPLSIFKRRNVAGANLMMAPIYATMLGTFFLISLYLQTILRYSPIQTGLSFLPIPIILGFMSTRVPGLVARYGFKRFLIMGPLLVAAAIAWISGLPVDGHYFTDLLPAFLVLPIGVGMTFMPIIAAATSGVPANQSGLASGLITTSQQMGGALGLAILSSIAASVTKSNLSLGRLEALVQGYDRAFASALVFVAFALILAITVIKQPRRPKSDHALSAQLGKPTPAVE